ncbi:MAG: hypothetical protein GY935_13270, partial [Gammaproteobacteria bacterium]|nr:hypothetical protein [Gammaproteobacteria bacterium]
SLQIRGYEQFFIDMMIDPDFSDALMGKITDLLKQMWTRYMAEVGDYVQLVYVTDDLGTQTSLLLSPKLFRKRVKPFMKDLHDHIKSLADVKLMMHTDGAVLPLIEDLLEIGVDILNPVQTSTAGMGDTAVLREKFGDRLAYHGAMDVQQMMPNATMAELEWEIARRMTDLGKDGGYIVAPCHNIGHDIPPQTTIAFFDMVRKYARYPIELDDILASDASYFQRLNSGAAA